jgi:hypothetical protein
MYQTINPYAFVFISFSLYTGKTAVPDFVCGKKNIPVHKLPEQLIPLFI